VRHRGVSLVFFLCLLVIGATGCGHKEKAGAQQAGLTVVTTLFPVYDFTRAIAGEKASVTLLVPPGVEAHSFEPKPGDLMKIEKADLFIYTGKSMEPWTERLLKVTDNKKLLVVDTSSGITMHGPDNPSGHKDSSHNHRSPGENGHGDHGNLDPHIWLDFANAGKMVDTIAAALAGKDPGNREYYEKNATAYKAKLDNLDKAYKDTLSRCGTRFFVHGGHYAFGYLARRYDLVYVAAYRGSPNSEPSPRHIAELEKRMKTEGLRHVYYEELITPRIAETLARETGARLLQLHGAHNISRDDLEKGTTFISLMEQNLAQLKVGLECR